MEDKVLEKAARRKADKKPVINTTIAKADLERLEIVCKKYDTTKGRLIRAIVLDWLEKYEAEQEAKSDADHN